MSMENPLGPSCHAFAARDVRYKSSFRRCSALSFTVGDGDALHVSAAKFYSLSDPVFISQPPCSLNEVGLRSIPLVLRENPGNDGR
jgi:hypothetical protein